MKKKITPITILIFLVFITKEVLIHANIIINTVTDALNIWIKNIFPSLFPFFIISGLLSYYNIPEVISELFKPLFQLLFKCKKEASYVFFMSMISGSPGNSKYIKELYEKQSINELDATKILMFTHFASPMFIIGTIGNFFLQNKKATIIVLISHYLGNIIIGLIFRNYNANKTFDNNFSIKKAFSYIYLKKKSFSTQLSNILMNSINTILYILGVITIFMILNTIINENININSYIQNLFSSFIEMTQGLKNISMQNITLKLKTILTSMIISFGGLSIHIQILGILNNIKIKYISFLTARIMHALIAGMITFILI